MQNYDMNRYEPQFLKNLLRRMLLIRRFEEKAAQMYGLRKIGGFCHLYIGQEAVAVGSIAALDLKKDYVLTAYRDHGHAIACGMDPKAVMAELFGKKTGCSKGKGGSMHLFDVTKNFYGGNGIVGAHIPLAVGFALKIKYKNEDGAVLCFFGDGAIHQGAFHESLNMAKIWNLPVVFICENNHYGMGTSYERVSSVTEFSQMGAAYNITGVKVNGMDVIDVFENVKTAVKDARQGKPVLLDIDTYRYKGHSMTDPGKYRTKEEIEQFQQQDPVIGLKTQMIECNIINETDYNIIDEELKRISAESVEFAENSEEPPVENIYEDLFA